MNYVSLISLMVSNVLQVRDAAVAGGVALAGIGLFALGAAIFSSLKDDNKKHRYQ